MAESVGMPETDITALTEALKSQQQLLQMLYADLDQEREASSTAADEALSMILRLQGEKSAVKMEANQYKRLAEEKICHAEEALAIFEDLIYQKEMEIASLEFQLQAYRYKLLSLGVSTELGTTENVYPENLLQQRGDGEAGGVSGAIRRINSLPPLELKDFLNKKCPVERESESLPKEKPMIPKPESCMKKGDKKVDKEVTFQGIDAEKKSRNASNGNLNSIWEQIKKLDDRVREISDCQDSGGRGKSGILKGPARTCSLPPIPKVITSTSHDTESEDIIATFERVNHNKSVQETEAIVSTTCSTGVHDVFEVPQSYECSPKTLDSPKSFEGEKKEFDKLTFGVESSKAFEVEKKEFIGKDDLICDEISEVHVQDETERVKKRFHGKLLENRILSRTTTVDSTARERVAAAVTENQARFQQLWRRIERLEGERSSVRNEISHAGEEELKLFRDIREQLNLIRSEIHIWKPKQPPPQDDENLHRSTVRNEISHAGEEDLKLFRDIREQLNLIRSEIHTWKPKQPPRQDDEPLHIVQEAMLHFWL
ncbi:uncharacterized protein LOC133708461 [Rosa rugosa]|uniref:uncharacterized protein LOC133708461 n=1 Tax=Rosa rugosa TaxID=74645 RepID=UPI002B417348|nr:uncharacterized protein LOC133708461 [Rosa rugosa]